MLKALHLNSLSLQDNMISVKVDEQRRDDVIQLIHEQVIIVDKNIDWLVPIDLLLFESENVQDLCCVNCGGVVVLPYTWSFT